jgi:hypothetical protein
MASVESAIKNGSLKLLIKQVPPLLRAEPHFGCIPTKEEVSNRTGCRATSDTQTNKSTGA